MAADTEVSPIAAKALRALVVITIAVFPIVGYESYVAGSTTEKSGVVVSVKQIASDDRLQQPRYVVVRLENAATVHARVDGFVTAVPGDRVAVVETTSPILHTRRYRYFRHIEPSRSEVRSLVDGSPE